MILAGDRSDRWEVLCDGCKYMKPREIIRYVPETGAVYCLKCLSDLGIKKEDTMM